MFAVVIVR